MIVLGGRDHQWPCQKFAADINQGLETDRRFRICAFFPGVGPAQSVHIVPDIQHATFEEEEFRSQTSTAFNEPDVARDGYGLFIGAKRRWQNAYKVILAKAHIYIYRLSFGHKQIMNSKGFNMWPITIWRPTHTQ